MTDTASQRDFRGKLHTGQKDVLPHKKEKSAADGSDKRINREKSRVRLCTRTSIMEDYHV
ncbi:hypothetical protein CUS_8057 [Ruminococcus albus 8]|uniref:Uncharacterized protein n=1 Tax=Ruminococcus albus 8 TaxID=246199 RepID=E9SAU4_RUMAL|nr:hypothetical protein CUS_8057 [Ruminococcus albus 8]